MVSHLHIMLELCVFMIIPIFFAPKLIPISYLLKGRHLFYVFVSMFSCLRISNELSVEQFDLSQFIVAY